MFWNIEMRGLKVNIVKQHFLDMDTNVNRRMHVCIVERRLVS